MRSVLIVLLMMSVLYSCKSGKNEPGTGEKDSNAVNLNELPDSLKFRSTPGGETAIVNKDSMLKELTKEIFTLIRDKKYQALDSLIHPEQGIRFSPYSYVSNSDKKFSREEFARLFGKNRYVKINWGNYDGSGDPITLTATEYFKRFVYDANYVHPEQLMVNQVIGKGNTTNNIHSYYTGADFTESFFSGTRKNEALDWRSVRLVFAEKNGKYYLIGVIHDQWTI